MEHRRRRSLEIRTSNATNGHHRDVSPEQQQQNDDVSEPTTPKVNNRSNGGSSSPIARLNKLLRTPAGNNTTKPFSLPRLPRRRRREPRRHRLLLEDHYRVDKERRVVLPGVPRYEKEWARDLHDFFNLLVLVPVVALNAMNWNWDMLLSILLRRNNSKAIVVTSIEEFWTGEWFHVFFAVTAAYFVVDLVWVLSVPSCVRSPSTIIQHHIATILYILIPYRFERCRWCMGACMSVEINTWLLIARRVLNRQGFPPWTIDLSFVSIRVKLISVCFYVTWILIRCIFYPALMRPFYYLWKNYSDEVGTGWNLMAIVVPLHACFCLLNIKWTYDLLMSKLRYWRKKGRGTEVSKGL